MAKKINYEKKQITGKRTHIILSKEAYLALKKNKERLGIGNTTSLIEFLLLSESSKKDKADNIFTHIDKILSKMVNLINFNKKLYIDINATFSNINQIAYRLNIANLNGTLDSFNNEKTHKEITQTLMQTRDDLADLKIILTHLLQLLEQKQKGIQKN